MKKVFWLFLLVFSVFMCLHSCSTDDEEKEKKATDVVDSTNPDDKEKEKKAPGAVVSESIKFSLKAGTKNTLVVSWEKPKDDGGVPITGYTVRYYPKSGEKTPKTKSSPEKQNSKGITPPPFKKTKSLSKEIFTKEVEIDGNNIKGDIITVEIDISKFPPNTVYVFEIIAKKADVKITLAKKEYTTDSDKPVPPSAPKNIEFKEVNDKSLKVIWEKPDSDGGSPITKYTVEYAEVSDDSSITSWKSKEIEINDDEAALELEIDGLKAGKEYIFRVVAVNKGDVKGDYSNAVTVNLVAVKGVTLDTSLGLVVGETKTLTATIDPPNATNQKVSWSSDDTSIATVDDSGKVNGLKVGQATVTATTNGVHKAICKVYVTDSNVAVNSISLDNTTLSLVMGEKKTLKVTIDPPSATNQKVSWTSSETSIAKVDAQSGEITALKIGQATITVTTADGGKKATCTVNVKPVSVKGVTLDNTTLSLVMGEKKTLTATIDPPSATNQKVSWSSNEPTIAKVNSQSGEVTALKVGTAIITATTADGDKKASCDVTVNPISVKGVTLDNTTLSLVMGAKTLKATIDPSNATNKKVSWSSDKTNIATVDDSGEVTALKVGQATITATTADGDKKASCDVTVTPVSVKGVTLDKTTLSLVMGAKKTLTVTIDPPSATNQKVVWSSDDSSIATVDDSGDITGLKVGQTTITVTTTDGGHTATCDVTVTPIVVSTKQDLKDIIYKRMQDAGYNKDSATDKGTDIDLNDIDISNLKELKGLFSNITFYSPPYLHHFNGDISNWNVSKVTDMVNMFSNSQFNGDISNWKVSKVTDMVNMFYNSQFNQDISNWKVSKVTDMKYMFDNATNFDNGGKPDGLDKWRIDPNVSKENMFSGSKLQRDNNLPCWADGDLDDCPVKGVDLNQKTLSLVKGTEETLTAIFDPVNTPNKNVRWSSSNSNIATVDTDGTVKAVSAGEAIITVTTDDGGYTARCKVYVTASTVAVTKISLDKTTLDLALGGTQTLTATIDPSNATNQKVIWSYDDSSIAIVDVKSGELTALKAGKATITVTTDDGGYTASCTVTVNPIVVSSKQQLKDIIYKRMQAAGYNKDSATDKGTNIDLNDIDISQLDSFNNLFSDSSSEGSTKPYLNHFNGDISNWKVDNITNMGGMFSGSKFNGDISNWNISKVTDMGWMFSGATNFDNGGNPSGLNGWKVVKTVAKTDIFKGTKLERDNNLPCWFDDDLSDCPNP